MGYPRQNTGQSMKVIKKVFEKIEPVDKQQVMIVGDSLTSDMQGGVNAGILTCWYNPGQQKQSDLRIDYEIRDLHEIYDLL